MKSNIIARALLLTACATAWCVSSPAVAATVAAPSGATADVASAAHGPLQCVVSALVARGYPVRFMRGHGRGTVRGSLHPSGMALDVNQTARNHTTPRMPADEVALAAACGAISGAAWSNGDSGHFQVGGWAGGSRRHGHRHGRRHRHR